MKWTYRNSFFYLPGSWRSGKYTGLNQLTNQWPSPGFVLKEIQNSRVAGESVQSDWAQQHRGGWYTATEMLLMATVSQWKHQREVSKASCLRHSPSSSAFSPISSWQFCGPHDTLAKKNDFQLMLTRIDFYWL